MRDGNNFEIGNLIFQFHLSNRNSKIDFVELASEPNLHFFLVAMDGIIFKYDLVTKGLIFSFKSQATKAMKLYGNDDKLLVASES